jgi:hypothetical protein
MTEHIHVEDSHTMRREDEIYALADCHRTLEHGPQSRARAQEVGIVVVVKKAHDVDSAVLADGFQRQSLSDGRRSNKFMPTVFDHSSVGDLKRVSQTASSVNEGVQCKARAEVCGITVVQGGWCSIEITCGNDVPALAIALVNDRVEAIADPPVGLSQPLCWGIHIKDTHWLVIDGQ